MNNPGYRNQSTRSAAVNTPPPTTAKIEQTRRLVLFFDGGRPLAISNPIVANSSPAGAQAGPSATSNSSAKMGIATSMLSDVRLVRFDSRGDRSTRRLLSIRVRPMVHDCFRD